ncbi:diguanylate cyclase domain-containing protein [Roseateles cavernae]|uniref:diguanylate cyclase domain-containing protein n=1 Tax=Roseateles cavernae TaxID=3153578 RepID=UPI0032E4D770
MNIFLVEDSPSIRRLLVRRLDSMAGARIVGEASRQDEAIALIEWLQPEMVLLDLSLASGSGLQVLAALRGKGFRGQVMVLTSQAVDAYRQACTAAGADGFYDKASGLDTLFDDLGEQLEARRDDESSTPAALLLRDALTGLYSQLALLERADQAIKLAAAENAEIAAFVLVLKGLDALRQTHGEAAVEAVLRETAQRLSLSCTPADVLARHASEQFALVLTRIDSAADAASFARQIGALMAQPFQIDGGALALQSELGMALFPRDAVSARALLTLAEAHAYGAALPQRPTVFCH